MKKKSNPSARAQMNTSLSLSLVTIWLEWSLDLGEDLISLILSCIECYSSCKVFEGWKLGCIEVWWLGVFISPTIKRTVGEGFCRMVHRSVQCATGHYPVRQPRHPAVGFWRLELLTSGSPDSPVVHRTVRWCTGQPLFTVRCAFWLCTDFCAHCSALTALCRRPLAL
jgi:hypothetical protein